MSKPLGLIIALAILAPIAGCGDKSDRGATLLFTQSATRGSFKPARCCPGMYVLTLDGVSPQLVWFQDRPGRKAGQLPAEAFGQQWADFGFQADPPNAALSLTYGKAEADTVVVELRGRPEYKAAQGTVRYKARLLANTPQGLASFRASRDDRVPQTFGSASLFIDASAAGQVPAEQPSAPSQTSLGQTAATASELAPLQDGSNIALLLPVGRPLATQLQLMFESFFSSAEQPSTQTLRLQVSYSYSLGASAPDTTIPVALIASAPFTIPDDWSPGVPCQPQSAPFVCRLATLIQRWIADKQPSRIGAKLNFDLSTLSSTGSVTSDVSGLTLDLTDVTDLP